MKRIKRQEDKSASIVPSGPLGPKFVSTNATKSKRKSFWATEKSSLHVRSTSSPLILPLVSCRPSFSCIAVNVALVLLLHLSLSPSLLPLIVRPSPSPSSTLSVRLSLCLYISFAFSLSISPPSLSPFLSFPVSHSLPLLISCSAGVT